MNFTATDKPGVVEGYALVKSCDRKSAKNGTFYLDVLLADKDSDLSAKLWDYKEGVHLLPEVNTLVKVRGALQNYNGNDQLIIQRIRPVTPADAVNPDDFVKSADYTGEAMYDTLLSIVRLFHDEELKAVVTAILEEKKELLLFFPAAEKLHHAMTGGLLYHTLSIVRLAQSVASLYDCIDGDLLIAGAVLHDIAKLREYSVNAAGIVDGHTLEGALLGHLVMGAQEVGEKCDALGISATTKTLLQHMLISHHGQLEFGAAVRPAFIEAQVLSQLDLLDANMYEMADAVSSVKPGEFTGRLWMLDNRKLYNHGRKGTLPTANLIPGQEQ